MLTRAKHVVLGNDLANRLLTSGLGAVASPRGRLARRLRDVDRIGPVDAPLPNGARLRMFAQREWISGRVFWQGWDGYEPETARIFWALALGSTCVVDVGANLGYYALLAALASPSARVLAIEPVPDILTRLRRNIDRSGADNIEVIEAAATAASGSVAVRMPASGFDDRGVVEAFSDESHAGDEWRTSITRAVAIDDLGLDRLDLVKIDIEGGELDALAGMSATLERCRPIVVCELCSDEHCAVVEQRFGGMGYHFAWITDAGTTPVVGPLRRPWPWRNCVLVPDERAAALTAAAAPTG